MSIRALPFNKTVSEPGLAIFEEQLEIQDPKQNNFGTPIRKRKVSDTYINGVYKFASYPMAKKIAALKLLKTLGR